MKIDSVKYPLPNMRHHTSSNMYYPLKDLKKTPNHYPPVFDKTDWNEHFDNGQVPEILDVGCGKGAFLFDLSEKYTDKNVLGIDVRHIPVKWIKGVIDGEKMPNVSAMWYSVANGMKFIADNSVDMIFYLFPDPWPKRNHLLRRAFNEVLLTEFQRCMKKDGILYLATDVDYVDDYHKKILDKQGGFDYEVIATREAWDMPLTNKEKFCIRKDIFVYRLICRLNNNGSQDV